MRHITLALLGDANGGKSSLMAKFTDPSAEISPSDGSDNGGYWDWQESTLNRRTGHVTLPDGEALEVRLVEAAGSRGRMTNYHDIFTAMGEAHAVLLTTALHYYAPSEKGAPVEALSRFPNEYLLRFGRDDNVTSSSESSSRLRRFLSGKKASALGEDGVPRAGRADQPVLLVGTMADRIEDADVRAAVQRSFEGVVDKNERCVGAFFTDAVSGHGVNELFLAAAVSALGALNADGTPMLDPEPYTAWSKAQKAKREAAAAAAAAEKTKAPSILHRVKALFGGSGKASAAAIAAQDSKTEEGAVVVVGDGPAPAAVTAEALEAAEQAIAAPVA